MLLVGLLIGTAQAGNIKVVASTVPSNGDVNPYGIVVVPVTMGSLTAGNLLISNFNNSGNLQGTGTTIVQITPSGTVSLFAQIDAANLPDPCPGGVGLTTALGRIAERLGCGWQLADHGRHLGYGRCGMPARSRQQGQRAETFYGSLLIGPWDMTASDNGTTPSLFFSNVLNGTVAGGGNAVHGGTVVRMDLNIAKGSQPSIQSMTVIGSGFAERADLAALVIGPTGVHLSGRGDQGDDSGQVLYVADRLNNRIASISKAMIHTTSARTGDTVSRGGSINDPAGCW